MAKKSTAVSTPVIEEPNGVLPPDPVVTKEWFQDRITGFQRLPAIALVPHPKNPRKHGPDQKFAMRGLLQGVGFVEALVVRQMGPDQYQILNGHMRADLCQGAEQIPCLIVDVNDAEADLVVATHDQISQMAMLDEVLADTLAKQVWTDDQAVNTVLRNMLMFETKLDDQPKKRGVSQNQLDLMPLPYEHYDYVMILARTTPDFNRLCAMLKIGDVEFTVPGGYKRVGIGRCIDAARFFALIEEHGLVEPGMGGEDDDSGE